MKKSDTLAMRNSEIRTRLNEIAGMTDDEVTEEITKEADKLNAEYRAVETQYRAALVAEDAAIEEAKFDEPDGEGREKMKLANRASVTKYFLKAIDGRGLDGAEAEATDAFLGDSARSRNMIPFEVMRTANATDSQSGAGFGSEMHRTPDQQLFNAPVAEYIGVNFDTVDSGQPVYPIITNGPSAAQRNEGADAPLGEYTFTTLTLQPRRVTSTYIVSREALAGLGSGYDNAMVSQLRTEMGDQIDAYMVNGGGSFNGLAQVTAEAADSNTSNSFARWGKFPHTVVDGIHATQNNEVKILMGPELYQGAAAVYLANTERSGLTHMRQESAGVRVTDHISTASNLQNLYTFGMRPGALLHRAAVWNGIEVIRDTVTLATMGEVRVTAIALLDFHLAVRAVRKFPIRP